MYPRGGEKPNIVIKSQGGPNLTLLVFVLGILSLTSIGIMTLSVVKQLRPVAFTAINKQINYQGKLQNAGGITLPDGDYSMKFSVYAAASGGTPLWTECGTTGTPTARTVAVSSGVFSVLLGDTASGACPGATNSNAIDLDFNSDSYYLGVTIEADSEMTPRKRIGASGYAFNADLLDGLNTSAAGGASAFVPVTDGSGHLTLTQNLTLGGVLKNADGAVDAPSYTFTNDLDTGFYSSSDGVVKYSGNGTAGAQFSSSGVNTNTINSLTAVTHTTKGQAVDGATAVGVTLGSVPTYATAGAKLASFVNNTTEKAAIGLNGEIYVGNGTTALPSISALSDPDTGISFTGSNLMVFSANGVSYGQMNNILYWNIHQGYSAAPISFAGNVANGATAIGVKIGNVNALSTAGAKIVSFYSDNLSTEKAYITKDGNYYGPGGNFSGLSVSSAVYTDGSKNLTSTAPTSGAIGYWSRTGTTLSPATANDVVSVSGTGAIAITGTSSAAGGKGIYGTATDATAVANYGGYFTSAGTGLGSAGVYAESAAAADYVAGFYAKATNTGAYTNIGGAFYAAGETGIGIRAEATSTAATVNYGAKIYAQGTGAGTTGVYAQATATGAVANYGGYFEVESTGAGTSGVYGLANGAGTVYGVYGAATDATAVTNYGGYFTAAGDTGRAVYGAATDSGAVINYGGYFTAVGTGGAYGVYGAATGASGANYGVYGDVTSATGWGGYFTGGLGLYASAARINSLSASSIVYTDADKNLTSTPPGAGSIGYWTRGGTTLSPATANDIVAITGNSGNLLTLTSTATDASNKALSIAASGATVGTDYGAYISNTGAATANVGLYATASGGTANYAAIFAGRVGVGIANPDVYSLHVDSGTSAATYNDIAIGGVGGWSSGEEHTISAAYSSTVAANKVGSIIFRYDTTNGGSVSIGNVYSGGNQTSKLFTVLGSGNVGIGTTSPLSRLDVRSITAALPNTSGSTNTAIFRFGYYDIAWAGVALDMGYNTSSPYQAWIQARNPTDYSVNRSLLLNPNGGNVGIGTTGPFTGFHVNSANTLTSSYHQALITSNDTAAIDKGGSIGFGGAYTGTTLTQWAGISGRKENVTDGNYAGYLALETRANGGNLTEQLRISSAGNVGIGTATPTGAKLQIESSTDGVYGIYNIISPTIEASTTQYDIGNYSSARQAVQVSQTNSGYAMGVEAEGYLSGAGNLSAAYGIRADAGTMAGGTGTVTSAYGAFIRILNSGGGTISNGYGLYVSDVAASTDYGIYQVGANDDNYFAGNVGIGVTPTYTLDVSSAAARGINSVTSNTTGAAVYGTASSSGATENYGGYFSAAGTAGAAGVYGLASASGATDLNFGGYFEARGGHSWSFGVKGYLPNSVGGKAVVGVAAETTSTNYGGYFTAAGAGALAAGAYGEASAAGSVFGVVGYASSAAAVTNTGGGFTANGQTGRGVYGQATNPGATVNYGGYFVADGAGSLASGVYGTATGAAGVSGVTGYASSSASVANYGGYFQAAGTGGAYGVYGYASGASGTNYGVYGQVLSSSGYAGYFTGGYGLYGSRGQIARAPSGNDTSYGLVVQGAVCIDDTSSNCPSTPTSGTLYTEGAALQTFDLAELYESTEALAAGDVVSVDLTADKKVVKSTTAYQNTTMGVVSTAPGITLGGWSAGPNQYPIALAGRVPVKVNDENGSIAIGDILTSSSTSGVAMRATRPGQKIGVALEAWSGAGEGVVEVFMSPGWDSAGTIATDGTAIFLNDDFTFNKLGEADATILGYNSRGLTFRGSGWDGAAAQNVEMKLANVVTDALNYKLSVLNNAGTEIAYLDQAGAIGLAGKFYPASPTGAQNTAYIFYRANRMRTNAAGWATGSFDFAEMFLSRELLEAGDVVVLDSETNEYVKKATTAYDNMALGIVSTEPGFLAGANVDFDDPSADQGYPVGLAGRVPTKVSAENGPIRPGDFLTTSGTPGVAMKATESGMIIGTALESFDGPGIGLVKVFVNLSWYNVASESTPVGEMAQLTLTGDLNMAGNYILNVGKIVGVDEKWSIDENGILKVKLVAEDASEKEMFGVVSDKVELTLSGSDRLENGTRMVDLSLIDPEFIKNISAETPLKVIVTLTEPANGVYVAEKTAYSFRVAELNAGTTDAAFDWIVIARRKGYEDVLATPIVPPSEPAPSEPAPSEPAPSEPTPSEPAPSEPAPSEPAPSEPAPSEPAP